MSRGSNSTHPPELHGHGHEHPDLGRHRHPHHHTTSVSGHEHAHPLGLERYTYLVSPLHDADPRFKILGASALLLGVVAGSLERPVEFALVAGVLLAAALAARLPLGWLLARSAVALPVALTIAGFAPLARASSLDPVGIAAAYAAGWPLITSIAAKAWASAFVVSLVAATTPFARLLDALRRLRVPDVFITLGTFLYRFASLSRSQVVSMRHAMASRAPRLSAWRRAGLYGHLGGNLLVRAYARGERLHAAMLSRGFDGVLPAAEAPAARPADWLLLAVAALLGAASLLY